jgi:hypothetical protein
MLGFRNMQEKLEKNKNIHYGITGYGVSRPGIQN